jgi:hypothetical protein
MSVPVKFRSGFSPSVVWIFFQLLLVRFVFSALTESNSGGTNGGSTTNQPFKVFLPHLPLMQFFLSEQNTCKYSDKQIRDFVKANDAKSPYYISSLASSVSPPPTKNFYFAKLQNHVPSDSSSGAGWNTNIVKAKAVHSGHVTSGYVHWELYRNYAPIEAGISDLACPQYPVGNSLFTCMVVVRDTFGDLTVMKMRSIESRMTTFTLQVNGVPLPTSVEPDLDQFGRLFVSCIMPPGNSRDLVHVHGTFSGNFLRGIGENANVTGVSVTPQTSRKKQSVLDIDIRFTGLPLQLVDDQIIPRQLIVAGLVRGLGLGEDLHAIPADVYPCPTAERCALADSRPTHDARADDTAQERRRSLRSKKRQLKNRYKDPRDPSLPPSVALRMFVYGEYDSVREFMDRLELSEYRNGFVPGNISAQMTSPHGKDLIRQHVPTGIVDFQISSVHPIRLDGEYVFVLSKPIIVSADFNSLYIAIGVVVGLGIFSGLACYALKRWEQAAVAERLKQARIKWALEHPEWKKKYEFALRGSRWKPPKPPSLPLKKGEQITAEMRLAQIRHLRAMRAYQRANKMMTEYNEAALRLQGIWRQKLARTILQAQKQSRREREAALFLQRIWRGKQGRDGFIEMRNYVRNINKAALLVQRVWYKKNGMFSTFVLMRSLNLKNKQEQDRALREYFQKRAAAANLLARHVKRWVRKRFKVVTEIQRVWRGYISRRRTAIWFQHATYAASLLQKIWRGKQGRRAWFKNLAAIHEKNQAAVRLQLAWYRHEGQFSTFVLMRCLSTIGDRAEIQFLKDEMKWRKKAMQTMERGIKAWIFRRRLRGLVARLRTTITPRHKIPPPPPPLLSRSITKFVPIEEDHVTKTRLTATVSKHAVPNIRTTGVHFGRPTRSFATKLQKTPNSQRVPVRAVSSTPTNSVISAEEPRLTSVSGVPRPGRPLPARVIQRSGRPPPARGIPRPGRPPAARSIPQLSRPRPAPATYLSGRPPPANLPGRGTPLSGRPPPANLPGRGTLLSGRPPPAHLPARGTL